MIFEIGFIRWLSARQSVAAFESTDPNIEPSKEKRHPLGWVDYVSVKVTRTRSCSIGRAWTIEEAFHADMGGFILCSRDYKPFPLDAQQLHWLYKKNYLQERPMLDRREIEEKNKVNGLLRTITICQIVWFLVNTVGRWGTAPDSHHSRADHRFVHPLQPWDCLFLVFEAC